MTTLERAIHQCQLAGACDLLRTNMTTTELCLLMHSPEGIEFLLKGIPTIDMWRYITEEYQETLVSNNIYLDSGLVELDGTPQSVIALGRTTLVARPDQLELYHYTALHGASAEIHASGWAVVRVETDKQSHSLVVTEDRAIAL